VFDHDSTNKAEIDRDRRDMKVQVGVQKARSDPLLDEEDKIEEIEKEENEIKKEENNPFETIDEDEVNAFSQGLIWVQPEDADETETTTVSSLPSDMDAEVLETLPEDPRTSIPTTSVLGLAEDPTTTISTTPPSLRPNEISSNESPPHQQSGSPVLGFVLGFLFFGLMLVVWATIQEARKRRRIRQVVVDRYLGGLEVEDFEMRKSIIGGWHGRFKKKSAKKSRSDSDTDSVHSDDDRSHTSGSGRDQSTIMFSGLGLGAGFSGNHEDAFERLEWGQLSTMIEAGKKDYTMQLADKNMYLDDSSYSSEGEYDADDLFASVRYDASENFEDEDINSLNGDETIQF